MIRLTKEEVKKLKNNKDGMTDLLVRKAILKEMLEKKYSEEEIKILEILKENVEIEFYLDSLIKKDILIYDYELLDVYRKNIELFKEQELEVILPQLKQAIYNQKLLEGKKNLVNQFIEKYKINDLLNEYIENKTV